MSNNIQRINPEGLSKNPAFSQAVVTTGTGKTIYIGGQNAINDKLEIIGDDLAAQTVQVMKNIQTILSDCGATMDNVVKMNICIVQGQDPADGFRAAQPFLSAANPPAISAQMVSALGNPKFLLEIDAIAFVAS